jgi:hypothetical protein
VQYPPLLEGDDGFGMGELLEKSSQLMAQNAQLVDQMISVNHRSDR